MSNHSFASSHVGKSEQLTLLPGLGGVVESEVTGAVVGVAEGIVVVGLLTTGKGGIPLVLGGSSQD